MSDDGEVWTGDRCIAPDDPRNWGPEWERITPMFLAKLKSVKLKDEPPEGLVSQRDAMKIVGSASPSFLHKIAREAGISYVEKYHKKFWNPREVEMAAKKYSINGKTMLYKYDAAQYLGITWEQLKQLSRQKFKIAKRHYSIEEVRGFYDQIQNS